MNDWHKGNAVVRVAIIDGPYDAGALALVLAQSPVSIGSSPCSLDATTACDHGTFIVGLLGARCDAPLPGLCSQCRLLHVPLFAGGNAPLASVAHLADAITVAVAAGAKVINLSLAIEGNDNEYSPALAEALDQAEASDAIVLAAAGNQGRLAMGQLISHSVTIPVVAVDAVGRPLPDCNFGPAISRRGISAFGHHVLGYAPGGGTTVMSGTSVATAIATATLANVWSLHADARGADIRAAVARLGPRNRPFPPMISQDIILAALDQSIATAVPAAGCGSIYSRLQGEGDMKTRDELTRSLSGSAGPNVPAVAPANGLKYACGSPGGVCSCADSLSSARFIYVLGTIDIRFPDQSISEELRLVAQRLAERPTDPEPEMRDDEPLREWYARILRHREARYIARQACWILKVEGLPAYYLTLLDLHDLDQLIACLAKPDGDDLDLFVGSSSLVPVENCPGAKVPILTVDQFFSIDQNELKGWFELPSTSPKSSRVTSKQSSKKQENEPRRRYPLDPDGNDLDAEKFFRRVVQSADNFGDTDEWRALNYLAVRYKVLYLQYAEMVKKDYILESIKVMTSRLWREKHIVDPVFTFQHKISGVSRKYFVRVDVSHMYPMIANELAEYFDR